MLNLGTAAAKITLDISDLTSNANKANATINGIGTGGAKNLDTLTGKISTYGASIQKVSTVVAGFGLAVTGAFGIAAKGAIGFDSAMGNVNSIAQLTKGQLSDLTNQVLDLSKATGQAPTTLADGLYDIESSGFAGADALKILTAAANAANAGLSDTGTSAAVITAVLNSYSLGADQAGHASDVLFQTVNDGVITFGQLSQYMGQTLPIASALNVPIEQLGASYALMTKNGLPVAETQTDINALLTSAVNPTTALTTAVQGYGYANAEALIKAKGLPGFLDFLTTTAGGSETALTTLLGTQNASAAAMLLMKDNGKQYTDELGRMDNASKGVGATQTALNKQQDTTAFKLKQLAASFSVLEIRIGQQLEPVINVVAEGLTKLFNVISGLPTPVLAAIAAIGGVVGVVALVAGSIGLVLPKILEMKTAFGEVFGLMRGGAAVEGAASSFSLLSPPILIATAALVAFGIAYKTNFLGIKDGVNSVIDTVKGVAGVLFGDGASGKNDADQAQKTFDKLTDTQKAYVRALQTAHAPQSQINAYLESQNIAVPGVAKKYDLLTKTQRAWVDGLKASGQPQSVIDGYLKSQGVNAEYTTSQYKALRKEGMNPLSAELKVLGTNFGVLNKNNPNKAFALLSKGLLGASKLTQTFGKYFGAAFGGNAEKYLKTLPAPLRGIAHGIGTVLDATHDLNQAWKTGGFTGVLKELPHVVGNLGTAFRQGMSGVGDLFRSAAQYAGPFSGTLKSIGNQFDDVGRLGQDMAKGLSYVMKGDWTNALKWGKEAVSDFGSLAKDSFDAVVNTAKGLGSIAADLGDWTINTAAPTVTGWVANTASDVWDGLKSAGGWAKDTYADLKSWWLKTGEPHLAGFLANDGTGSLRDYINGAVDNFQAVYATLKTWTLNTAKPVVEGWIKGIGAAAGGAWDFLTEAAGVGASVVGTIASWTVNTAAPTVTGWVTGIAGDAWGLITQAAGQLPDFLATVGSWTMSLLPPALAGWIGNFADDPISALETAGANLLGFVAHVNTWALNLLPPGLSGWIQDFEADPLSALQTAGGNLLGFVAHVNDWVLNLLPPGLSGWISDLESDPVSALEAAGANLMGFVASVGSWTMSILPPGLAGWIGNFADDPIGSLETAGANLIGFTASVTDWTLNLQTPTIEGADSVVGAIAKVVGDADYSTVGTAISFGLVKAPFDVGKGLADAIIGIPGFISDLAGKFDTADYHAVGEAIGHGLLLIAISPFILAFIAGEIIVGFVSEMVKKASDASTYSNLWSGFKHGIATAFSDIAALATGIFDGFWDPIEAGLDKVLGDIKQKWGDTINTLIGYLNKLPGVSIGMIETPKEVRQKLGQHATTDAAGAAVAAATDPRIPRIVTQSPTGTANGPSKNGQYTDFTKDASGQYTVPNPADYFDPKSLHDAAKAMQDIIDKMKKDQLSPAPTPDLPGGGGASRMPNLGMSAPAIADMLANLAKMPSVADNATSGLQNLATAGLASVSAQAVGATAATGLTQGALDVLGQTKATPKITQQGAEVVTDSAITTMGALQAIPTSWSTALKQAGAEDVTKSAGITRSALEDIPISWFTGISQAGAEAVTGSANVTQSALESIPTSWFTSVTQQGAETVRDQAYDAASALFSIPDSRFSTVDASVSGIGDVLALANAIDAVHSVTAYVNVVTTGGLSAVGGNAKGGYTKGAPGWLAEQGPELLRFPDGSMGLAREKAVYDVPMGTYVYTAPKTANMLDGAGPIPGYARGGYVRPWRAAAPTSVPTRSASQANQTIIYRTTVVQALRSDELQHLMEQAEAGGELATNLGPRLTQIRQTASTPTVGRR